MAMREDCKHFQSRTYPSGEVARFCVLDLAPEAPWRCPENCPSYERRLADATWTHGSLVAPPVESEPEEPVADVTELLASAEEIVEAAAPEELTEVEAAEDRAERRAQGSVVKRARRRIGRRGKPTAGDEGDRL
ncbi:MAG: hypothetical protein ABSA08_01920 [Acidimicrobiales bacterium]